MKTLDVVFGVLLTVVFIVVGVVIYYMIKEHEQ